MSSSSRPPTLGARSSTHHTGDDTPGPWLFNDQARIITHAAHSCSPCSKWALHYVSSVAIDDISLREATDQRNEIICAPLAAEVAALRTLKDSFRRELATAHTEITRLRVELDATNHKLLDANNEIFRQRDDLEDVKDDADHTITGLQDQVADLKDEVRELEHGHSPRRRKVPRHGSRTPPLSRSRHTSSCASRPVSPMMEDRDVSVTRSTLTPPLLLSRLSDPTAAVSSTLSLPLVDSSQPLPAEHAPSTGGDLASRLADAASVDPTASAVTIPALAATPLIESVGFLALHPVLSFSDHRYGCTALDTHGDIDLSVDTHFIYALQGNTSTGTAWTTTLLTRGYLMDDNVSKAIAAAIPLPISHIIMGGRNGVLIAATDPTTEEVLNDWFTTPSKNRKAFGYTKRIRHTPPELRTEFHQCALERWDEMRATRRQEEKGKVTPKTREPTPYDHNGTWKWWLQRMQKNYSQSGDTFKYIGIPLVCQSYQTAHLDGARAILMFIPRTKGTTFRDPLRIAFLCAAAALLSVPDQYQEVLAQLGQAIAPARRKQTYNVAQFGDESHLGINEVARFLATTGVPVVDAEQWRQWAAAYVDMELDEHPQSDHAPMLQRAKEQARARINSDPSRVVTRVHPSSPGYYNPAYENARAHRAAQQSEESSSSHAEAGPSSTTSGENPHDTAEGEVHLSFGGDQDKDMSNYCHVVVVMPRVHRTWPKGPSSKDKTDVRV